MAERFDPTAGNPIYSLRTYAVRPRCLLRGWEGWFCHFACRAWTAKKSERNHYVAASYAEGNGRLAGGKHRVVI